MKIPLLILAYKRKDKTRALLDKIKYYKPKKLYIAVDGPTSPDEFNQVKEVIDLFNDVLIDWDCEIHKRYLNVNLGTRYGIESAINWFFSKEQVGIILEDDCLPVNSFFDFMEYILLKYENDESIMSVSGHNCGVKLNMRSYYSSTLPMTWGWGTWARAWNKYDSFLKNVYKDKMNYIKLLLEISEYNYKYVVKRLIELDLLKQSKVEAWDYRWFAAVHCNKGITIYPPLNLIKNIGFDEFATHTKNTGSPIADIDQHELSVSVNDMFLDINYSNVFWDKYIQDRTSKRAIQNYVLKKVLMVTNLEIEKKSYKKIYILGKKDLGKVLYSKLSQRYEINGFCGNDVGVNELDNLIIEQKVDKDILIISSIEGEHEEEIISQYNKYFTVYSWRKLLTENNNVDDYINENFLKWVNEGVFL